MYRLLAFIFVLVFLQSSSLFSQHIDVQHYRFLITLNDHHDSISGTANIKAVARKATNQFAIDLAGVDSQGKGMSLMDVKVAQRQKISTSFVGDKIHIFFTDSLLKNDTINVTISYKGIPADGLIIGKNKFGNRTFFADNWPHRAHQWLPCVDEPGDKASVEFITVTPQHYKVISNGVLQKDSVFQEQRITHWKEDIPIPTKVMVIGVADFSIDTLISADLLPITAWSFPENAIEAKSDYSFAPEIVDFFSGYIANYPYKKLANVQSKTIFGGMENASAIFYHENSVNGLKNNEELIAHEIAHQWFGNMVTEKHFSHLWLSEGFATYLTDIYLEQKYGANALQDRLEEHKTAIINFYNTTKKPVVDSISPAIQLINANSYRKGAWILHMLRKQLGDSVFHKIIRTFYNTYQGGNADSKDFQVVCENISKKDLSIFFRQWLYQSDLPEINYTWKYNKKTKQVTVTISQLQSKNFVFPLSLDLICNNGEKIHKKILIEKQHQTFTFQYRKEITEVIIDPKGSLLYIIK